MHSLQEQVKDFAVRSLPAPPHKPLTSEQLFVANDEVDWVLLRNHLKREGRVHH